MLGRTARGILLLLMVTASLHSCGRTPGSGADAAALRQSLDTLLWGHFRAFEQGELDTWALLLEPDVFFTAAAPSDVFLTRDSVLADMRKDFSSAFASGLQLEIEPIQDTALVNSTGTAAVLVYALRYLVTFGERTYTYLLRATYLVNHAGGSWRAAAVQYSQPVAYDSLFLSLMSRKVHPVAPVPGQSPGPPEAIAGQFRKDVGDILHAAFASGGGVVVTPSAISSGPQAARDLVEWLGPAGTSAEAVGPLRGELSEDGETGWVAGNLRVPVFAGPESAVAPMRALFVYRREGDRWKILHASVSVALLEGS